MLPIIWLVLMVAALYFLVVRPQRQRVAAHEALMASLEVGDDVMTAGGMFGTIVAIDGEAISVEIAPGVLVRFVPGAIAKKLTPQPPTVTDEDSE